MPATRYHVTIDTIRTTVTIPPVLAQLRAVKLRTAPDTAESHAAIRAWLQDEIDRDPGAVRYGRASQRLAHQAISAVADPVSPSMQVCSGICQPAL